jgi:hypothetical protein
VPFQTELTKECERSKGIVHAVNRWPCHSATVFDRFLLLCSLHRNPSASFLLWKIRQGNDGRRNGKKSFQAYSPAHPSSAKDCPDFSSAMSFLVLVAALPHYVLLWPFKSLSVN